MDKNTTPEKPTAPKRSAPKQGEVGDSSVDKFDKDLTFGLVRLLGTKTASLQLDSAMSDLRKADQLPKTQIANLTKYARKQISVAVLGDAMPTGLQCNISLGYLASTSTLPGYCTLDDRHIRDIRAISESISSYAKDPSRDRPLNILMLASPGAGKSHFIKCLANSLGSAGVRSHTYNMTALESTEDLAHPLDAARNLKVQDHLPMLFLDEFDSAPENYARLLPLLWDGDMHLGHRDLKLGKVIIVLAGSKSELPEIIRNARSMQPPIDNNASSSKLVDLLSRINGGELQIPSLDERTDEIDRRIDKICIIAGLLIHRFGPQLNTVPRSLLRFTALASFKYGVRSMSHLVESIPYKNNPESISNSDLKLPLDSVPELKLSSLAYHVTHVDQGHGVVDLWKQCQNNDCQIDFGNDALSKIQTFAINELLKNQHSTHRP